VNLLPWHPDRPERTEVVHELTQMAFAPYAALARPSGALAETVEDVRADLLAGGGLIAYDERWETALGALRWRLEDDHLWVKRVAVDPAHQGQGVGDFLMDACRGICHAHRRDRIRLGVRHALTENRAWYERRGYRVVVHHDDWDELEATVEPLPFADRATLWKYEHPDHLQGTFEVDVLEERPDGWWVAAPAFTPTMREGELIWVHARALVGWMPRDEWWTAWFTAGRQSLKVDICTPAERRVDGDFEFRDLCLDVVVWGDEPAAVVDEDELEEACYPADLEARTRAAADEVLRRVATGEEPFASEGFDRLSR
jgi:GNAT superfamily N-acetyltransferase